jgi:hypothetical protein
VQKAKELAKGTRRIPLMTEEAQALDADAIDAEFVDVPDQDDEVQMIEPLALAVSASARVTPGRARRATDAYAPLDPALRPVIAIG